MQQTYYLIFQQCFFLSYDIFFFFQQQLSAKDDILNITFFPDCIGTKGPRSMWYEFRECGKDLDGFQRAWEKGGKPSACCRLDEEPGRNE